MRVLAGLSLVAVLLAGAAARAGVMLTPSTQPGTCVLKPPTDALRPVPKGCLKGDVKGEPIFSPDGRMLYMTGTVFARDPGTGVLSRLDCATAIGGTRCPPANTVIAISPDGRSLYALDRVRFELTVYDRGDDGTLTQVQCLEINNPADPYPTCDAVLPRSMTWVRTAPDGSSVYLVGNRDGETDTPVGGSAAIARLARDPATGRLTPTDCLAGQGQPGCRIDDSLANNINGIAAVVGQDIYLIADDGYFYDASALLAFRADPGAGTMTAMCAVTRQAPRGCLPTTTYGRIAEAGVSPDGRRLYVSDGPALRAFPRDPTTDQLGPATCVALQSHYRGRRVCANLNGYPGSVAVSPDGRRVVTTTAEDPKHDAVGTYDIAADGSFDVAGCLGTGYGCAPPIGVPRWLRYPPNGPGPYLVTRDHRQGAIQLLVPSPTLRLSGFLTQRGANRVSVTCPAGRARACRGTVRISYLTDPRGTEPLQAFPYKVGPGKTRSVSLRLTAASRRDAAAIGNSVAVIVRVFDDAGPATPGGIATCLRDTPGPPRCSPPNI